ncbi:hypothetical protein C8R45DRAFT_792691, partial [Mycena sanguinolenta]
GQKAFVVKDVPEHLASVKRHAKDKILYKLCGKETRLKKMRDHVATHILSSMRGMTETGLKEPVGINPCGFCELDGCFTQLLMDGKKKSSIQSSCHYHYKQGSCKAS